MSAYNIGNNNAATSAISVNTDTPIASPLYPLIKFDLLMQSRDRSTWVLIAVAVLLAWAGLWQGQRFHREAVSAGEAAIQQQIAMRALHTRAATDFFANPQSPASLSARSFRNVADVRGYAFREHLTFAVKPPAIGGALAIGQADILPSYARVRAESMESVRNANEIEHPARLAAGRFDLAFVVLYLWPLVLLALTASVLTREREANRLNLLRLQGVQTTQLLIAQVAVRTFAATGVFTLLVGFATILLSAIPLTAAGLIMLAQWMMLVFIYSIFWAGVASLISSVCQRRVTASFAGFGAWVLIAIVVPQVLVAFISASAPMPSRETYLLKTRASVDQINRDRISMVTRFYDQHPEWRPKKTAADKVAAPVTRLVRAEELERALAPANMAFDDARKNQTQRMNALIWLSPVSAVQSAFTQLAGHDAMRHDVFFKRSTHLSARVAAIFSGALTAKRVS